MTKHAFIDMRGTLIFAARSIRLQEVQDALAANKDRLNQAQADHSEDAKRVAFWQQAMERLDAELKVLQRCILLSFPQRTGFLNESFYVCQRPGASAMLARLNNAGITCHILTDWDQLAARQVIKSLGLEEYFKGGVWSSREDADKPPQVIKGDEPWVLADKTHAGWKLLALGLGRSFDEERHELTQQQQDLHLIYTTPYDFKNDSDGPMRELGAAIFERLSAQSAQ